MAIEREISVNVVGTDENTSKTIQKVSQAIANQLVKATAAANAQFKQMETNTDKTNQVLQQNHKAAQKVSEQNQMIAESLEEIKGKEGIIATITSSMEGLVKTGLGIAGAFAGVVAIDKTFIPLNAIMGSLTNTMIGAQNRAAAMSTMFRQTASKTSILTQKFNQLKSNGIDVMIKGLNVGKTALTNTRAVLQNFTFSAKASGVILAGTSKAFLSASKHTELFEKGLAGTVVRASLAGAAFNMLGINLLRSDSILGKMAGVTLIALAASLAGAVFVVKQLLAAVGGLIQSIGDNLTAATEKQIELFAKAEKNTFAFTQTVTSYAESAEDAAAQTNMWNSFIADTSAATGETTDSLQALVAETVAATEAAHLNEIQMKELINRTIDLSERAHKPAMDTLVALINGMNGAGQSVISLGLHMSESAIQHSKLNAEVKKNFKNLSDSEKAQARFAVLMEQAGKAAGFASNNADLYSKSVKLQENAQKELNAELGRGAAIINGQYRFGLATVTRMMTNFIKPILPAIGFLEALGGRFLQVTGFITKNILIVGFAISTWKAFNILLAKGVAGGVFAQQLPFLNKSILQIVASLGATNANLGSLKGVAQTTFQILKSQSLNAVKSMLGLEATAKLTAKTFSTQLVKGLKAAGKGVLQFGKRLLVLLANPIVIKFALISAAIFLVVKALQKIEERTGIFSKVWEKFSAQFAGSSEMFQPVLDILKKIGDILTTVIGAAVKFVAAALSVFIGNILRTVKGLMLLSNVLSFMLPDAMVASAESLESINKQIDVLNKTAKDFAKEGAADLLGIFVSSAEAADGAIPMVKDWTKELASAAAGVGKMEEKAKKAFEAVKDFTPKINMAQFQKETAQFDTALKGLKKKLEAQKIVLIKAGANEEEIKTVETRISQTTEAIKGLQLRSAKEIRSARLKIVETELTSRKNKIFTVEQEIKQMRLDFANETRSQAIEIETQRILEQRNLATDAAKEGISVRQAAILEANNVELEAFRSGLQAQSDLAINMETQKALELANIRAGALAGTPAGAGASEDVETLQAKVKQEQLAQLRENDRISEQEHQQALTQIKISQMQARTEREIELQNKRSEALGLTEAGLESRLAQNDIVFQMEMEQMRLQKETIFENEVQFQESMKEMEIQNQISKSETRQRFIQEEIDQNIKKKDSFAVSLAQIRLAQAKHGQVMGTLLGVQQTAEFKGVQGALSNLATLRNSKGRKEFEIGRAAALAGAGVNIAQGIIASLAPPPIGAGPLMGPILAGTIAAAGAVQMAQISAQKYPGGQADQGMDSIPKSLNGKSFILSAGERVVQPEANKKLTSFLDQQEKSGGGGNIFHIHIGSVDSDDRVEQVAQRVKSIIREDSERGEPIISARGVVNE